MSEIKLNKKNRNSHPKEQIEQLRKILRYQGFRRPGTISNRTGVLVCGEGRYLAAKAEGMTHMPVMFQDYKDESQEYSDGIADNGLDKQAILDFAAINQDLADIGDYNFDIDWLGLKDFKLDLFEKTEGLTDPDQVPENVETRCKPGDIWKLGEHRLMCGDSTKPDQVKDLMNGEKAKAWISDPPYGINHVDVSQEKGQSKGYKAIANDDLKDEELRRFLFEVIETSKPHLEKGFAFYMWHAMKTQAYFSQAAAAAGILFHRQIVWVKERFVFGRGQYHWQHELCLMGWLEGDEPKRYGEMNQTTVWKVTRENDKIHPTQKPVELYEIPIKNHLKNSDIFMEPFGGSGSGIIAAEKTGTRCYCMEFEPSYCDKIIARWEQFTGKEAELL